MESKDEKTNAVLEYDPELISILMRQTTYTKEEALQLLEEKNNDLEKCITHFLEIPPKKEPEMSINQKIFKNIRDNM